MEKKKKMNVQVSTGPGKPKLNLGDVGADAVDVKDDNHLDGGVQFAPAVAGHWAIRRNKNSEPRVDQIVLGTPQMRIEKAARLVVRPDDPKHVLFPDLLKARVRHPRGTFAVLALGMEPVHLTDQRK
jgi:hypothetical protein